MATKPTPAVLAKPAQAPQTAPQTAQRAHAAPTPAALVVQGSSGLALPADLMAELGAAAKDAAARERPSVSRISLKSGVLTYNGAAVPGNQMEVLIVAAAHRNVYYAGRYDPNNIVNPNCFALSENGDDMEAHEVVPDDNVPEDDAASPRTEPATRTCQGCAMGAWGSNPQGGRGKACKETRRLLLLPADCLGDPAGVQAAEMAILDIPVTSVKNYANMVNTLATTINLPMWAVVTMLQVVPDAKTQFQVKMTPMRPAGQEEIIRALMKRRDEALRVALQPYDGVGGENTPDVPVSAPTKRKF